ncbi:alpha/beta fold hydrolase [Mycobacterium montefiorense]|uniref:Esterase n=1 Tax=Mycobacterium montefiorense TaxID=154654 RepID=A0AA37PLG4_9MYCO|nr:alpha/beta hydrolase [Mycobacterium montefiorense]GBG40246.1 esterase [Mycobacterium montefiorense]GKU35229.1 esterase [Mycobacterium montefiorense]GKU40183.1 esterase [Mycobacterium montefiorense]GKU46122.1 esterase [Mycobacterium montefiorense]GKU52994.1 esterase [Mycobacterium montefiorense]
MARPGLVLVHGGAHAADCWDLTIAELSRQEPELPVLAVDLPGRGSRPADLTTVTVTDWVNSAVADIDDAGLRDVVIVGHSMGGLTVPGIVAKLGAARVREMILLAAFVPPQGSSVVQTLRGPLVPLARSAGRIHRSFPMPRAIARFAFCNGMTREQRALAMSRLCLESPNVIFEPADRSDLPGEVPRTWIMTLADRALSSRQQLGAIESLGGVDTMICVDACHDVMFSRPGWLATTLADRCRSYR